MPSIMTPPVMFQQMKFCGEYHTKDEFKQVGFVVDKINRYLDSYWRTCTMAKNHAKTYPKPAYEPLTYINNKLSAADIKKFDAWLEDEPKVYETITKVFYEGYQAKVAHWGEKEVFNILLIAPKEGDINSGKAISSKSPNWFRALAMCAYKHTFLAKGDWSVFEEEETLEG